MDLFQRLSANTLLLMKLNMRKKKTVCFIIASVLSIIGWIIYGRFVYITTVDPDLSISEYDKKYFANNPSLLSGIDEINITTIIVLAIALSLIAFSGYLLSKTKMKTLAVSLMILDVLVLSMLVMAYL